MIATRPDTDTDHQTHEPIPVAPVCGLRVVHETTVAGVTRVYLADRDCESVLCLRYVSRDGLGRVLVGAELVPEVPARNEALERLAELVGYRLGGES